MSTRTPGADRLGPLLDRLDRWLARHRPRYWQGLRPGATDAELRELAASLDARLPESLRELLAWHNGQARDFRGALEQDWLLMGTRDIVAARPDLDRPGWLPFLDDDAGSYLCLDTTSPGPPVRAFWLGSDERATVAPSLADWLEAFVDNLERGRYVEDPERGTMLPRA